MSAHTPGPWVEYNPLASTYDTPDGTQVPAELADTAQCLADVIHIAAIRDSQRAAITKAEGGAA